MKAMILAAGEGRRMRPLTLTTPKPLLTVRGCSLIEHHIRRLAGFGVRDLVINTAYLADQFAQVLGGGERWGVTLTYSREPQPLETGGALHQALPLLGDAPFLLINGDIWTDYSFDSLLHTAPSGLGHLVLVPNPSHKSAGDFSLLPSGKLGPGNATDSWTFSGISVLSPRIVADYPRKRSHFPLREVFDWAVDLGYLTGEVYRGTWCDVGTPERLAELNGAETNSGHIP